MSYKVVVIDDKMLIRKSLIETIQWERLGCQVVGEAESGLEAKGLIQEKRPELIITDIKMPGMDGLELAEYAKEILPESKVIVITGYQEFEYAKRALSLGVYNMILKPINNRDLEEMVLEALKALEEQRTQAAALLYSIRERRRSCLAQIIKGRRRPWEDITREEARELDLSPKFICLVYVRARCVEWDRADQIKRRVLEQMEQYERTAGFEVLELMSERAMVMAVIHPPGTSARERKIRLKHCLLESNRIIRKEWGESCFFVISRTAKSIADLEGYHTQAWEVFQRQYFSSDTDLLFMESHTFHTDVSGGYLLQDLDSLFQELSQLDPNAIQERADEMMEQISREVNGDAFRIKCLMSEICITLIRYYRAGMPQERVTDSTNEILERIDGLSDIRSSKEYLAWFLGEMQPVARQRGEAVNPVVSGALDHIRRYYREELSLTDVAEAAGVNASYLSRLLKKETGRNFSDILTECRITAAKKLLDKPGSKVIDVCEQVGYRDYTYFYQVFKRVEGISPSEYKKRGKKI